MAAFDLDGVVGELEGIRAQWRTAQQRAREPGEREFPSRDALAGIFEKLKRALFPMRLGPVDMRHESENYYVGYTLDAALRGLQQQARLELRRLAPDDRDADDRAGAIVREFAAGLPSVRRLLDSDVLAAFQGDPAARSVDEVLLCYPGIHALIHHRLAHQLYRLELPLLARIAAEIAHGETGIDIHPGARIGPGCFIDHGTGVVIGETALIGRGVRIYQAVTLGAKRFATDAEGNPARGLARHPIVEDDVVIYAGATILGRITLGQGAVIGGNVWITEDVAAGATVTQAGPRSSQRVFGVHEPERVHAQ